MAQNNEETLYDEVTKDFWKIEEGPKKEITAIEITAIGINGIKTYPIDIEKGFFHQDIKLKATDDWGGGRNNDWVLDISKSGCWDIEEIPRHFCDGREDLENLIMVLVKARNIIIKKWPNSVWDKAYKGDKAEWDKAYEWVIMEDDGKDDREE